MARASLTADADTNNGSSYETAEVQPGAAALVLLFVTSARPAFGGDVPGIPRITGNGLVWDQVATVTFGAQDNRRLTCFRASGAAPVSGPVTIDFGGEAQDYCAWSMFSYSDLDPNVPLSQAKSAVGAGSSLTVPINASTSRDTNVGAIALELNNEPDRPVAPGAGFTEIHEVNPDQFLGKGATLQTEDAPATIPAVSWTWTAAENAGAIVLQVRAAALATPPPTPTAIGLAESLARRFEPVLSFHPDEDYFPVNAKRYVEQAALWTAGDPPDDNSAWVREVDAGQLAAAPGEGGDFRFDDILGKGQDSRFLELGGWQDATDNYADRSAIAEIYRGSMEPSRYWYHAELFDTARLDQAARRAALPNLAKLLDRLVDPHLLCYYLFFPAHEQSVGKDTCQGTASREVASHAGDWQCIAVLLSGNGSGEPDAFTPKFLGISGSRPAPVPAISGVARPYAFDDDENTVIKVEKWAPGAPDVIGDHPRLYVAKGSHSLYTAPGDHDVDPYQPATAPSGCGLADGPRPGTPPESTWWVAPTMIAKFLACGFLPGGIITSLVSIAIEAVHSPSFGAEASTATPPDPDQAPPSPGSGKTVRPAGVTVPGAGADIVDWRSQRGLVVDGRTYDFVVDRTSQAWWPGDDGEKGFWGRWGQHVTFDALPRRAGPRFPDYAAMFLTALADGDSRDLLDLDS